MQDKFFFEGENTHRSIFNYVVLLTLATIISTYGVISGSTDTVIGAMILSPMMLPIMATTLAIVLGDSKRASISLGRAFLSVLYVVLLAIFISIWVSPVGIDFKMNPQILSQTSPDIFALFVALASGVAGAFAISRKSISDSLPGATIAISLVPPLTVVGISLAKGQWSNETGSFLLFLTSFFRNSCRRWCSTLDNRSKPGMDGYQAVMVLEKDIYYCGYLHGNHYNPIILFRATNPGAGDEYKRCLTAHR